MSQSKKSNTIRYVSTPSGTPDTTADGKQAHLILGDSIAAGLTGHTASTLPTAGTAFEYDRNTNTIINFGDGAGIAGFSWNSKSPWSKFSIDNNAKTGKFPVIINRASSGSTISPSNINNDWQTTGTNYNLAIAAADDCLSKLGLTKLKSIRIILGINDVQNQDGTGAFSVAQIGGYLDTLITNLIAHFGSDVPIIFTQIGRTNTITVSSRLTGVRNLIKSRCNTNSNCYIGSNLAAFTVGGFWESDNIHPNVTGNDHAGAMHARWDDNSSYSKWPRAIISCHFEDISTTYKDKIATWFSTYATEYITAIDCWYNTKAKGASKANAAFDWAFVMAPEADGGFTYSADSHIATAGATNSLFNLGYNPFLTSLLVANNDYGFEIKIKLVNTSSGVTAAAFGGLQPSTTKLSILRQLNTLGINWAVLSATSFTYAGENNLSPGSWMGHRDTGGTISLRKNGTVIAGPTTDTVAVPPSVNHYLGAYNNNGTATDPINAQFERVIIFKSSVISNKSQFVTDLDTLQA